jgi:hypothetical protein
MLEQTSTIIYDDGLLGFLWKVQGFQIGSMGCHPGRRRARASKNITKLSQCFEDEFFLT